MIIKSEEYNSNITILKITEFQQKLSSAHVQGACVRLSIIQNVFTNKQP